MNFTANTTPQGAGIAASGNIQEVTAKFNAMRQKYHGYTLRAAIYDIINPLEITVQDFERLCTDSRMTDHAAALFVGALFRCIRK